jgi:MscS family membrane protein
VERGTQKGFPADEKKWRLSLLIFPLLAMVLSRLVEYVIRDQINVTGSVLYATIILLGTIFLIFIAWTILVVTNILMNGIISSSRINEKALDADVIRLVCRVASFILIFIVFYREGSNFGIPVNAVFASAGIAGVGVALAARETLANFFGGLSILFDRPFKAGDFIVLDSGERGEVKTIGLRSTRILTREDILITIPNSVITNVKIVNQSAPSQHYRVGITIRVAYGSDLELVESVLQEVAQNNKMVMVDPEPRVFLRTFNESSIDFEVLVWVIKPHFKGRLTHEIIKAVYNRFNEEGINIPFPQRDIHIKPEREI